MPNKIKETNLNTDKEKTVIEKKDKEKIKLLMTSFFNKNASNISKIKADTEIYRTGGSLNQDEYGVNKVILKMVKRFCKVHASYVLKDAPNIKVPSKNQEIPESNQLASNVQRALMLWWKEQSQVKKYKRATRKACYKGMMHFYLSHDKSNETFTFNLADPEMIAFERVTDDPDSPLVWYARADLIDVDVLKGVYPKHDITAINGTTFFGLGGRASAIFTNKETHNKALFFEFFDAKYKYTYINDKEISIEEHGYPFLPFYTFYYFDLDDEEITSLVDFIKEPAKMINQVFGFRLDFTQKHADPPLAVVGKSGEIDPKKLRGGVIELAQQGSAEFLAPKANSIDAERMIELVKAFMHFMCGLSEEAMAGFTGSLTAAGVSIELRLDSTVREALDTQIILQDVIQKINRDYLKLMETVYPEKNLLESKILGVISDKKFLGKSIAGLYDNIVDFGGILPRSQDQIVRNTVTQLTTGMISKHTALTEVNKQDPSLEMAKIRMEQIEEAKLRTELEQGLTPKQKFFATPEAENRYMFETGEMATPAIDQDHELHIAVHEAIMGKLSPSMSSLLSLHVQMHKNMMQTK